MSYFYFENCRALSIEVPMCSSNSIGRVKDNAILGKLIARAHWYSNTTAFPSFTLRHYCFSLAIALKLGDLGTIANFHRKISSTQYS